MLTWARQTYVSRKKSQVPNIGPVYLTTKKQIIPWIGTHFES